MNVDDLVAQLTLDEKAALTAGADMWSTVGIDRLGVPSIRVTDGPNGARGPTFPGGSQLTSVCLPCGSALGATWDLELVQRLGVLLGEEARSKGCRVLLAPTVNIHRSPLAGRNFECYSEDPLLTGRLAAAFVRGVQSQGVATTVKHFAGNDAETERETMDSLIDERSLREIYLVPFELALRDGGSLGVMTGYNRLNGTHCSEHEPLLAGILRGEWGFEGFVLSDWYARGTTVGAASAGLDLEMPGPGRFFGEALARAVRAGEVAEHTVDAMVRNVLRLVTRFDGGTDAHPTSVDLPEHRELARRAAAEGMVLLTNDGILPLQRPAIVALIGPNADPLQLHGGGSAAVKPHYRLSLPDALREALAPSTLMVARGCDIAKTPPPLATALDVEFFANEDFAGKPVRTDVFRKSRFLYFGSPSDEVPSRFSLRMRGRFVPADDGLHEFSLVQAGQARLLIDGKVVVDGAVGDPATGDEFFGQGSVELTGTLPLEQGRSYDVVVEYSSRSARGVRALRIGCRTASPADLLEQAEAAAATADVAIVVVGTTDEWETEGRDRDTMDLPGAQNQLVERVLDQNPNTVVVVNAGAPVSMPWASRARAVIQAWFGGQEMANALSEVLAGTLEPAGRLPTSIPVRLEDNPSWTTFPGENSKHRYGEGLFVGYRWYERHRLPVRFAFGHGLSYTTFATGPVSVDAEELVAGAACTVTATLVNTGSRRGAEVLQCYVAPIGARLARPEQELKAFAKVWADPGDKVEVRLVLDGRAFAYWDPGDDDWWRLHNDAPPASDRHRREAGWYVDAGEYELRIGRSSQDISHVLPVRVTSGPCRLAE